MFPQMGKHSATSAYPYVRRTETTRVLLENRVFKMYMSLNNFTSRITDFTEDEKRFWGACRFDENTCESSYSLFLFFDFLLLLRRRENKIRIREIEFKRTKVTTKMRIREIKSSFYSSLKVLNFLRSSLYFLLLNCGYYILLSFSSASVLCILLFQKLLYVSSDGLRFLVKCY